MPLSRIVVGVLIVLVSSSLAFAEPEQSSPRKEKQASDEILKLERKLDKKLNLDFRRTALQDAVAELSKRSKIPISIDGESLKAEGFTQNMSQTIALKDTTVREALLSILSGEGHPIIADNSQTLIVLYDDKTHGFILTTSRFAEEKKLQAYPLKALTLEEKLQQKIGINFRKTALQDAFAYISGESGIPIVIDGDALKSAGFTQNMNQDMNLGFVTVQEALVGLMQGKGHRIIQDNPSTLVMIYNEQTKSFTVSTVPYAIDRGFKPYKFK